MSRHLEAAATVTIILAALAVTSSVVRREFIGSPGGSGGSSVVRGTAPSDRPSEPVYLEDWRDLLSLGNRIGAESAAVDVLVFVDLQCPYCQRFHAAYKNAKVRFGDDLRLTYIHYPLTIHPYAEQAARAAECAGAQGQFSAFVDAVFQQQASMGIKPWTAYATDAGIPDTMTFKSCAASNAFAERIQEGRDAGETVGATGTPTVIINGWRLPRAPYDSLVEVIEAILSESPPYDGAG